MRNPAQAGRAMSDRGGGSRSGGGRAVRAGAYASVRAGPLKGAGPVWVRAGPGRSWYEPCHEARSRINVWWSRVGPVGARVRAGAF